MKILLVTPAPPRSRSGNRVTALRWTRILRNLGHRVRVVNAYAGEPCDLMVALHARRSHASIARFAEEHCNRPLLVALTGTDLYRDLPQNIRACTSLKLATRLIVLQPMGVEALPKAVRSKANVIHQSVERPVNTRSPRTDVFQVCVLGHMRPVKDPFRTALAVRSLPDSSRVLVVHVGAALTPTMGRRARSEMGRNPRYRWLGELPRWKTLRHLARSRLLVVTSKMEGGANVVSEAIALGVPVVSSRIAGSVGLLGDKYPGYFPVGDTQSLSSLLRRAEQSATFYAALKHWCRMLRPIVSPARERAAWAKLLREL